MRIGNAIEVEEVMTVLTSNNTTSIKKINFEEKEEDEEVITQLIG